MLECVARTTLDILFAVYVHVTSVTYTVHVLLRHVIMCALNMHNYVKELHFLYSNHSNITHQHCNYAVIAITKR